MDPPENKNLPFSNKEEKTINDFDLNKIPYEATEAVVRDFDLNEHPFDLNNIPYEVSEAVVQNVDLNEHPPAPSAHIVMSSARKSESPRSNSSESPSTAEVLQATRLMSRVQIPPRSCQCRKSRCQGIYCPCFQVDHMCRAACKCKDCLNKETA